LNQLFITSDGSHTIADVQSNVTFHSRHGAISESRHIYIDYGLKPALKTHHHISIFEMGFGTGLNAFLSLLSIEHCSTTIYYETVEPFPLSQEIYGLLNYAQVLSVPEKQQQFTLLHNSSWNKMVEINKSFTLKKFTDQIETFSFTNNYDLVFWDAFDPITQPAVWSREIFSRLRKQMNEGARLLTYSSKTVVQQVLRSSGFSVEKLPGPHGKREIIRATAS
jgi:tRNA U34 5-methylaminomethyl-2-thiouridine-forming methyltransferase MnmC